MEREAPFFGLIASCSLSIGLSRKNPPKILPKTFGNPIKNLPKSYQKSYPRGGPTRSLKNHRFILLLLRLLGASWAVWGASWGVLGASWGRLGPSWRVLGASWGVLGAPWGAFVVLVVFFMDC